jgi:hypothetical protein
MVKGPGVQPIRVCLERNAECYKGSLQLSGRKKPHRHLIGISEDLASTSTSAGRESILLVDSSAPFVGPGPQPWAAGFPEWSDWFQSELARRKAIVPLLGIGCDPVRVRGNKQQFLSG